MVAGPKLKKKYISRVAEKKYNYNDWVPKKKNIVAIKVAKKK